MLKQPTGVITHKCHSRVSGTASRCPCALVMETTATCQCGSFGSAALVLLGVAGNALRAAGAASEPAWMSPRRLHPICRVLLGYWSVPCTDFSVLPRDHRLYRQWLPRLHLASVVTALSLNTPTRAHGEASCPNTVDHLTKEWMYQAHPLIIRLESTCTQSQKSFGVSQPAQPTLACTAASSPNQAMSVPRQLMRGRSRYGAICGRG